MPSSACALPIRSEEHTSELQSLRHLVCRLLLEKNIIQTLTPSPVLLLDALLLACTRGWRVVDAARRKPYPQITGIRFGFRDLPFFFFLNIGAPPNSSLFPHPAVLPF